MTAIRNLFALTLMFTVCSGNAPAQLFRKAKERRHARQSQRQETRSSRKFVPPGTPTNASGRPLGKLGQKLRARADEKDAKIAARKGISFDEARAQRIKRLETLGAIVGGLGAGLGGAADAMNYTSPAPSAYGRGPSGLPSSTGTQLWWNNYNRNYSTNPWHAPVYP